MMALQVPCALLPFAPCKVVSFWQTDHVLPCSHGVIPAQSPHQPRHQLKCPWTLKTFLTPQRLTRLYCTHPGSQEPMWHFSICRWDSPPRLRIPLSFVSARSTSSQFWARSGMCLVASEWKNEAGSDTTLSHPPHPSTARCRLTHPHTTSTCSNPLASTALQMFIWSTGSTKW